MFDNRQTKEQIIEAATKQNQRLVEALYEIERLRKVLQEIADEKPWPGIGEELQEMAREALKSSNEQ